MSHAHRMVPRMITGYNELYERFRVQQHHLEVQKDQLKELSDDLRQVRSRAEVDMATKIQGIRRRQVQQTGRLLQVRGI